MRNLIVVTLLLAGCAADDTGIATNEAMCAVTPACESATIGCGPRDVCAERCARDETTCPDDPCMATAKQSSDVIALRIGRSKIWAPEALRALAGIAVDSNVTAKCAGGSEAFNWLIKIDRKNGTITTGGARPAPDGKTYRFAREKVEGAKIASVCPGFSAATDIDIAPVTSSLTFEGNTFTSPTAKRVNVPIFGPDTVPLILPLSESTMRDVTITGSCVGSWDRNYACDGETRGWTTGGKIVSKITLEDADRVPIKSVGCMSLCALLANDPSKVGEGRRCKRGEDGKIPEFGDACVGGDSCRNAFQLVSTFGAYGVTIED